MIKLIGLTYLCLCGACAALDGRLTQHIFPPGSAFTVSIALSASAPEAAGIAHVLEMDIIYPAVTRAATNGFREHQRRVIREQIEEAVDRMGYDGRGCMRRFQCELNGVRRPRTAIEDILLVMFRDATADCRHVARLCPFSLLQIVLHSVRVSDVTPA